MSRVRFNSRFKSTVAQSVEMFANEYFALSQAIIDTARYWEEWETSEPFRDIVDSGDLHASGKVQQVTLYRYRITYSVPYVLYVYFGYMLADGRKIPARKWLELVADENNLQIIWAMLLKRQLKLNA